MRKKGDLKQPVTSIVNGEHYTYTSVTKACGLLGIPHYSALRYFRMNPKATSYTHKRTGITLTKTELL
jgi:hypothetical protein